MEDPHSDRSCGGDRREHAAEEAPEGLDDTSESCGGSPLDNLLMTVERC